MKHLLSFLLVMASMSMGSFANADQARVIKVKGQQAIVQFPQGVAPVVGETMSVGGAAASDSGGGGTIRTGSREHSVTLSTDLGVYSVTNGVGSRTQFDFTGRYGWNLQIFEFGPIATINYLSVAGKTDRTLSGGGFFDFNFVPNVIGQALVYGVGAEGTFGQLTSTVASQDTTTSSMALLAAANAKWYGLSDHFCLRGDAGLYISRDSTASANTTTTGLLIRGGIAAYF